MKMVRLWTVVLAVTLLAGCKNRLESYEPYSAFDERMAAAEESQRYADGQEYSGRDDYYGPEYSRDDYSNDYNYRDRPAPARLSRPAEQRTASSGSGSNSEVPFDSTRGAKHATNIGAI